ncbi:serine hydrolase domain-containing protein [Polaribacter pacificus]|nr:serine hydrolase [Polaribacter pacificus]
MHTVKALFWLFCLLCSSLSAQKLHHGNPSEVGMDSLYIHTKVDSILNDAIVKQAFPGAQVLVAKNHKIIFHKAYGFHSYDSLVKVSLNDVYDLASVTKILGPLPAIMKLYDEGKIDLDLPFSKYWKPWKGRSDKKNLSLREILAHQAGLEPYIVFLNEVLKKDKTVKPRFIQKKDKNRFTSQAYKQLFVKDRFKNKMYRQITRSKVSEEKKYTYSGLAFLLFPKLISDITNVDYALYLQEQFYTPLGASSLGYLPEHRSLSNAIVPTEYDSVFRKELTQNWVHDENAALMGGISGNAGLFGSAMDLAKIMQMYANYGYYNYKQYISKRTLKEFTKVQYPENDNRRGLGFDKPLLGNDTLDITQSYPAPEVSQESFGHGGFTGTFVWADPKNDLVFIFLSNRVYPSRTHRNIYELNIRPKVQQVFYQAIKEMKINK